MKWLMRGDWLSIFAVQFAAKKLNKIIVLAAQPMDE